MELGCNQRYRLKPILYATIEFILTKTRIDSKTPKAQGEFMDNLKKLHSNNLNKVESAMKSFIQLSNELIHSFIDYFVETVLQVRDEIMKETEQVIKLKGNFLIVYSDVCKESHFANIKAKILNVYTHSSGQFLFRDSNPKYIPVDKTVIKDISIALLTEMGEPLNLAPSTTPSFLSLNFKKFVNK